MRVDRNKVLAALVAWNGFREGPNNENPFGPYQGIANAAYCESFADGEPHRVAGYDHRIGLTESQCQFGAKGDAYTPWGVNHAKERGEWMADHASQGRPCDLLPGDQVFVAWNNGAGPEPDHVETVTAVYADGTYDTVGANTGTPNGVWHPIRRDRKYLLGRRRPHLYFVAEPDPTLEDLPMEFTYIAHGEDFVFSSSSGFHGRLPFGDALDGLKGSKQLADLGKRSGEFHSGVRALADACGFAGSR